ncbi:Flp pilus assembly complex ATPase component TadA [bacterium]|nr:Flp pilus assembly complex ATPase component TadA [bacterium]
MDIPKTTGFLNQTLKCIERYLAMKNIVEIMINQPFEVITEDKTGNFKFYRDKNLDLKTLEKLCHGLANYTGQALSVDFPVLSTFIPHWGYRFQAVVGQNVPDTGISISIRIGNVLTFPMDNYFSDEPKDIAGDRKGKRVRTNADGNLAAYIESLIVKGKNFLFSGGTSTGKTTCVNSMIQYIPKDLRIITLENMRELSVPHHNRVHLTASESKKSDIYKLLSNSILRMRPDRIIIGELTTDLTEFYLRLSSTGHDGSMTTVHADSPTKALDAIMRNLIMAGATFDISLMDYIVNTIHYVVQLHRTTNRQITAHIFKAGLELDKDKKNPVFTAVPLNSAEDIQAAEAET